MKKSNIVLIGFMGVGKTTVGKVISRRAGYKFIDTDIFIEEKTNMDIKTIFATKGESYFRTLERDVISEISKCKNYVIACGGGVVKNDENVKNLRKNGIIVCLQADADTIMERIGRDDSRPLVAGKSRNEVIELMNERKHLYEVADIFIDTSDHTPLYLADKIINICSNYQQD